MLFSASAFALILMGQSSAGDRGRVEEQRRLEACIDKIREDPAEAYEDGLAWVGEGGRPFARQCTALALVELGHEAEGALRLEDLANASNGGSLRQRIIYLTQSGNAWLLAGLPEAALVTINNAINLNENDPQLYADRAAAYIQLERWDEAEEDLNFAHQRLPRDIEILKMRAETRLNLGDLQGAEHDVADAMVIDRKDIPTLVLRGRVREAQRIRSQEEKSLNSSPIILID
jgi:tetratricopeptide (TPR) repeat protein